jgi:hypothetical protein
MERRHFLKVAFGFAAAAGAIALAASANAAPLPPISTAPGLARPRGEGAEPAVVSQDEVNSLKPKEVRWGRHWHHRHWHRRHWGWHRRWHRRHWHRRYW